MLDYFLPRRFVDIPAGDLPTAFHKLATYSLGICDTTLSKQLKCAASSWPRGSREVSHNADSPISVRGDFLAMRSLEIPPVVLPTGFYELPKYSFAICSTTLSKELKCAASS